MSDSPDHRRPGRKDCPAVRSERIFPQVGEGLFHGIHQRPKLRHCLLQGFGRLFAFDGFSLQLLLYPLQFLRSPPELPFEIRLVPSEFVSRFPAIRFDLFARIYFLLQLLLKPLEFGHPSGELNFEFGVALLQFP